MNIFNCEESNTKYSFEEVIANRKPGQVWVGQVYEIFINRHNDIEIKPRSGLTLEKIVYFDCSAKQYELKVVGIPFEEALAECEKDRNKRMKSLVTKQVCRVCKGDLYTYCNNVWFNDTSLNYKEIKGAWIVYEE